ncbi:MAG TPA: CrcB family protein [Opitutaceae bacterium]|nr:CrcB family protein [Opitutaceae bacterium]
MTPGTVLWVALGGAAGSVARAFAGHALASRPLWATGAVNFAGSLLLGWLMARLAGLEPAAAARTHAFLAVGFCGGFTTFSTFSWQTFDQMQKGQGSVAVANMGLSVALCLAATWAGWKLGRT